jgi:hypothetical protein
MNTETIQLLKLMEEPFPRLMLVTLQQGVSSETMWEPIKNPTFWYHERMLPSLAAPKIDLSQT